MEYRIWYTFYSFASIQLKHNCSNLVMYRDIHNNTLGIFKRYRLYTHVQSNLVISNSKGAETNFEITEKSGYRGRDTPRRIGGRGGIKKICIHWWIFYLYYLDKINQNPISILTSWKQFTSFSIFKSNALNNVSDPNIKRIINFHSLYILYTELFSPHVIFALFHL